MLTPEQVEQRRSVIGASDIPKIMGLSKFGHMRDVYEEKVGNVPPYDAGIKARMGNAFEHTIMDFAVTEGLIPPIVKDVRVEYRNEPQRTIAKIASNLDGRTNTMIPVECKMSGAASLWGSTGSDDVPMYVLPQLQCQMACCDVSEGMIVAFLSTAHGFDMRVYHCEVSEDFLEEMFKRCDYLWKCIEDGTPPEGPMTHQTAMVLKRWEGSEVRLDQELVGNYLHAKQVAKAAADGLDNMKQQLYAALGQHEIGLAGELGSFQYRMVNRKGYAVEPKQFRQLKHVKAATL